MRNTKPKQDAALAAQAYELVPIESIQPHPRNPRQGDVGAIVESINANRFFGACVVQRSTGNILAGNHRWMAARQCGLTEIPVIWVDVDDAEALRILLADNRTNDLASYNEPELADILQCIQADCGTLEGTGYDLEALNDLMESIDSSGIDSADGGEAPAQPTDTVSCPNCGASIDIGVRVKQKGRA